MILINRTFEIYTEASIESGEADESGFIVENEPVSFKELVSLMKQCSECSCMPASGDITEWLSEAEEIDFQTGDSTFNNLHYSRANPAKNAKYWHLAMIAAGFIK